MFIYNYDKDSKIYLGKEEADESPLEKGVFLLPQYATFIEPEFKEGYMPIWMGGFWGHSKASDIYLKDTKQSLLNLLYNEYENMLKKFKWRNCTFIADTNFRLSLVEAKEFFNINSKGSIVINGMVLKKNDFKALFQEFLLFKNELDLWKFENEKSINSFKTEDELKMFVKENLELEEHQDSDKV